MKVIKSNELGIDLLRILAILAVVGIHTTTRTLEFSGFDLKKVPFTLFLNQISRFAVPLFFIISGFVLELNFHLNENYLSYFKRRINRIFIPYIFWSLIYYFFVYYENRTQNFFSTILQGNASYQLYFIPTLLTFYLVFPIIHRYFKIIGNTFVVLILFFIQLSFLYYDYNVRSPEFYYPLKIALLNFYPFILGIFISKNYLNFKKFTIKWKYILLSGTIYSMYFIFNEGFFGYLATGNYLKFYSQWRPSILIYTIFIGGFFHWFLSRFNFNSSIIKKISKLSFFVFFVHVIILEVVSYYIPQIVRWDPIYFGLVTLLSFTLAHMAHNIPSLSRVTG